MRANARIADARRIDAYRCKLDAQRLEHADVARRANAALPEQLGEALLHLSSHLEAAIVDVRADVNVAASSNFALLIRGFRTVFAC